ncbi:MAG: hypothetical protein ABEJ96_06755, partial [Thiohalorhabdaceae bacterium]
EAARLMVEEGIKDFAAAKRKAARHLGGSPGNAKDLPTNREIQDEVELRLRMYRDTPDARAHLRRLRETALAAMQFFADYRPRLVGSVLAGTATEHSDINLHLFAETPEEVEILLDDSGIPFERTTKRHSFGDRGPEAFPAVSLVVGYAPPPDDLGRRNGAAVVDGVTVGATIFPPRSPVTGRPVERAKIARVQDLLDAEEPEPPVPEVGTGD